MSIDRYFAMWVWRSGLKEPCDVDSCHTGVRTYVARRNERLCEHRKVAKYGANEAISAWLVMERTETQSVSEAVN